MRCLCIVAFTALIAASSIDAADHSRSAAPAARLTKLLDAAGLQAIAAENPDVPESFVAALYFQGTQLLLISAPYSAPSLLRDRIAAGEHREVYVDLSTAGDRTGRIFVEDLGIPGLHSTREAGKPFDITWRDVTNGIHYDGEAAAQKLSTTDYRSRFESDDSKYAELLEILIAALTSTATGAKPAVSPQP
jgi:hypothetical protein